jgi:probable rRNA maturation factor
MNHEHLNRNGLTDVIAFGFRQGGRAAALVGDIYIAPEVARQSARSNGVPLREELTRLVVHGLLHVLGHDHPEDDRRTRSAMWKTQERLVRAVGRGRP